MSSVLALLQAASLPNDGYVQKVESLRNKLNSTGTQLQQLSDSLNKAVADAARETIDKLEVALTKDYKIAIFIRGDYDNRDQNKDQKKELLHQAVSSFQDAENRATAGLKVIGDIHAQVVEIENTQIVSIKGDIKLMIEQNANELQSVERQIGTTKQSMETMQYNLDTQTRAVEALQSKIADSERAALASDIGFSVLTLGIGNLVNNGPLDPFNVHGELEEARRHRDDAQNQLNKTGMDMFNLVRERIELETKLAAERSVQQALPQLHSSATTTESRCIMLQSQFGVLKDTSSKILLKVKEVESGASLAEKTAYTKKEFGEALLEMCSDALIDSHLIDEVQMITSEVIKEWGANMPNEIAEAGNAIDGKIKLLGGIPNIQARL